MSHPSSDPALDPAAAASRIRQAERHVRSSRRWHAASALLLALTTVAYFAALGDHPRQGPLFFALAVAPSAVVALLVGIRSRRRPTGGRALGRTEQRLANIYILMLLPAGIVTDLLPHPLPAMLMGIVPALPCLAAAWQLGRADG